jgi:predicted phosphodiesterase
MERRSFLNTLFSASLGLGFYRISTPSLTKEKYNQKLSFTFEDNKVTYYLKGLPGPLKIIQISDTHLWRDDARGEPFKEYKARMEKAYNVTKHYKTGAETNPEKSFEDVLGYAVSTKADLIVLTGDIFSFPSEAAIDWAYEKLKQTGIPFLYVAGNHDWHYEGMNGSLQDLRSTWTKQRLMKMYQGNDPLMGSYALNGAKVLVIDNSVFDIMPEQLDYFRKQKKDGIPFMVFMHIPMYIPGKSSGIGDPSWGAAMDKGYETEKRERWREGGHIKSTFDFWDELFASENLLGIFAGHFHRQFVDVVNGIPQFVAAANAMGAFTDISFVQVK